MLTAATCKNKKSGLPSNCYKGRLVIQAACMNYTISLEQGNLDTSLMASHWTDETTGKTYKNVFALGSRCTFPSRIKEGDEFYFTLDSTPVQNCAVCLMYYPVPPKKLSIKVLDGPCN
jgi:hypothetical protein